MSEFNPSVKPDEIEEAKTGLEKAKERLIRFKEIVNTNGYDGPYLMTFEALYSEVMDIIEIAEKEFSDGFQLRDLEDIVVLAAPSFKRVYEKAVKPLVSMEDGTAFLKDLVIFVYYTFESRFKKWTIVKWAARFALRMWVADKLAKYMWEAFVAANNGIASLHGKGTELINKILDKIFT